MLIFQVSHAQSRGDCIRHILLGECRLILTMHSRCSMAPHLGELTDMLRAILSASASAEAAEGTARLSGLQSFGARVSMNHIDMLERNDFTLTSALSQRLDVRDSSIMRTQCELAMGMVSGRAPSEQATSYECSTTFHTYIFRHDSTVQ